MHRIIEATIILSTLLAIASTFYLYRSVPLSSQFSATVIQSEEPTIKESTYSTDVAIATTTPSKPETTPAEDVSNDTVRENNIIIEKLPITEQEKEAITAQIHSLTNLSRSQNNLQMFKLDTALSTIAKKRSEEMIRENYFSHNSQNGCDVSCFIKNSGYQTIAWGENLAMSNGYHLLSSQELAKTFVADWLESSAHRDNILSKKFTHHGIGVAAEGERIIVTVVFASE